MLQFLYAAIQTLEINKKIICCNFYMEQFKHCKPISDTFKNLLRNNFWNVSFIGFQCLNCCYIHLSCLDPVKSLVQLELKNKKKMFFYFSSYKYPCFSMHFFLAKFLIVVYCCCLGWDMGKHCEIIMTTNKFSQEASAIYSGNIFPPHTWNIKYTSL